MICNTDIQESFATTLYDKFDTDEKAAINHFAKLASLSVGEYLYDHYCYSPNVRRIQKTRTGSFKDDKNYYETEDCYSEVIHRKPKFSNSNIFNPVHE